MEIHEKDKAEVEAVVERCARVAYQIGYERCQEDNSKDENTPINHINYERGYNQGVDDAWECVKKLFLTPNHGGMGYSELSRIFGSAQICEIANQNSIQQIMQKVSVWNEENKPTIDHAIKHLENAQRNETLDGYMTAKLYVDKALDMLKKIKEEQ